MYFLISVFFQEELVYCISLAGSLVQIGSMLFVLFCPPGICVHSPLYWAHYHT